MRIGIDGNEANVDQKVGVSVYTLNLLNYFQKSSDIDTQFVVYLREKPKSFMPESTKFYSYKVVHGKILWSQLFLPFHLNIKRNIDVFFAPAHYSPRFCPVPLIVTIHDLSYFYYPNEFLKKDLFKLKNWTENSVRIAKRIISVSKATKKDIVKWYSISENKIDVVYNGFDRPSETQENKDTLSEYTIQKDKYILYVGTIQPRKNITTLIKAFAKFKKENPDYKLVLTGKKGWLYSQIFKEVENENVVNDVIFTGYVDDTSLLSLYRNALCFVMPSLYEGFGIPILEAMCNDCPVLTSYTSSLPEIGGESCLYFDPTNIDDLVYNLNLLKNDASLRADLISKGRERIKNFSWEKCAEQTLEVIKNG